MIRRLLRSGRECPICGGRFDSFLPVKNRSQVKCPECGSRERHRHLWLYLRSETDFFDAPGRMLHIAPEPCFESRFAAMPGLDYVSGDLNPAKRGRQRVDVTEIAFPDDHFDSILCYHVLEHVPADRRAMRELYRVLRPGGWAIVQVPVVRAHTVEDPSVTDPDERLRRFGQEDHVRVYGEDFYERLREAGFDVSVDLFRDQLSVRDRERYGLNYNYARGEEAPDEGFWKIPLSRKARA